MEIPVTTPPETTAVAAAGVVKPPPVSVTVGWDAYPLPLLVTAIEPNVVPVSAAVAVAVVPLAGPESVMVGAEV